MMWRRMPFGRLPVLAAALVALAWLGCEFASASANPDNRVWSEATIASEVTNGVAPTRGYVLPPTATAWPTFTPVPTLSPTPAPTPTLAPTVPRPTTVKSSLVVVPVNGSGTDGSRAGAGSPSAPTPARPPTATPVSFGYIEGTKVRVRAQTMFMVREAQLPDFWPDGRKVFYARTSRYLVWWVDFDLSALAQPADARLPGLMRWLRIEDDGEVVLRQQPFTLQGPNTLMGFVRGAEVPGYWSKGKYRVELWDHLDRPFIQWDFEVR